VQCPAGAVFFALVVHELHIVKNIDCTHLISHQDFTAPE
jgi:hypothetical protein